jgi:hypothetical protein
MSGFGGLHRRISPRDELRLWTLTQLLDIDFISRFFQKSKIWLVGDPGNDPYRLR